MEDELATLVFDVDPVQSERVEMGVESAKSDETRCGRQKLVQAQAVRRHVGYWPVRVCGSGADVDWSERLAKALRELSQVRAWRAARFPRPSGHD